MKESNEFLPKKIEKVSYFSNYLNKSVKCVYKEGQGTTRSIKGILIEENEKFITLQTQYRTITISIDVIIELKGIPSVSSGSGYR